MTDAYYINAHLLVQGQIPMDFITNSERDQGVLLAGATDFV